MYRRNIGNDWVMANHFIIAKGEDLVKDEAPVFDLPLLIKVPLVTILIMSIIIGSYYKFIMYKYMYTGSKQNRNWMYRPINVLIMTHLIIHHITPVASLAWQILVCVVNAPLGTIFGLESCWAMLVVGVYGFAYLSVGSFGMAVYRTLYIRHEYWVKYVIGEKVLLLITLFLSISISAFLCFLYVVEANGHRTGYNMCTGLSAAQTEILIEYEINRGIELITTSYLSKIAVSVCIAIQMIEFSLYLWFFCHRYKNDNGNIAKLLLQEDVRKRNAKNASTFLGQFYGFMVEYSFLVAILTFQIFYAHESYEHDRALVVTAKLADFGLLSAIEVYSSPVLRSFMNSKN